MTRLFLHDKPIIGLDISQTGVKVMAVEPQKHVVTGYGSIDLDPTKVQQSLDDGNQYLTDNITALIGEKLVGQLHSNHVVIGVPTSRCFSRTFTVPIKAESTLKDAIQIEVEQYIPIPLASLYVDYDIIERTKTDLTVSMAAVPKVLVDNSTTACIAAGLLPVVVEPGINSVARLIENTEEGQLSTLIIDIGPANTDIAVLVTGAIRITGGLAVGGNTFTLDIAKKLNVALENAHQLKVLSGLAAGPRQTKIQDALTPTLQRIKSEINKVMRYYNERLNIDSKRNIEQVLIVGGGSNVPGIGDYFTNELVMPVRVASPWQQLDFGKLPQPAKQFRPRYITVAGLASVKQEEIWK